MNAVKLVILYSIVGLIGAALLTPYCSLGAFIGIASVFAIRLKWF